MKKNYEEIQNKSDIYVYACNGNSDSMSVRSFRK